MQERRTVGVTYMLDAKVADTPTSHLSIFNSIFNCRPALESLGLSTIRTVQQEQVDVT